MRNQTWDMKGTLIRDIELYLKDDVLVALDRLTEIEREPTADEIAQFYRVPPRDPLAEVDDIRAKLKEKGIL